MQENEISFKEQQIIDIEKAFRRGLKACRKKMKKIEEALEKSGEAEKIFQLGELLKNNFNELKKGMKAIEVLDVFNGNDLIKIPLNTLSSPQENLDAYFKKAKKLKASYDYELERLNEIQLEMVEIEDVMAKFIEDKMVDVAIKQLEKYQLLKFLPSEPSVEKTKKLTPDEKLKQKIKKFYSSDGYWIYVGGDAFENEFVSFKIGKGKDIWMHACDVPGSHVVIKLNKKGEEVPRTTIKEAALLAIHYSKHRGHSNVYVTQTLACHVKKVKGSPRGTVHTYFSKEFKVSDDAQELQKLMERTQNKKFE